MGNTFKTIAYIIGGFLVMWLIIGFFISILPWLLTGGVIIYIILKIKGMLIKKDQNTDGIYNDSQNRSTEDTNNYDSTTEDVTGPVVDVDYKEVD